MELKVLRHVLTSDELQKLHDIELELLIETDRICRKYSIPYSIDGGTLLGAVRHKGFIPWDDDADIIMNRDAYDKFVSVIDIELDLQKFYFQDLKRTKGYRWGYGKLRRAKTEFIRIGQDHMPYEQGVFLDIFVCDNVPDNYIGRCICNFHSFLYRKLFYAEVGKHTANGICKVVYWLLSLIPEEVMKKSYFRYIKRRNRKKTKMVKCLTFPACNRTYGYKREWYEDTIDMEFEGKKFKACRNYEEYLSFLYGDFMQLPLPEKRKVHPVSRVKLL